MQMEPKQEHQWLKKLVGDWTLESTAGDYKVQGTERVRAIGDLWIQGESRTKDEKGGEDVMLITLGFNSAKGVFEGSFVASMMDFQWIYRGKLEEGGRVLALDSEGPDMEDPTKTGTYRDVIELQGDDVRVFRGLYRKNGDWQEIMKTIYRRVR